MLRAGADREQYGVGAGGGESPSLGLPLLKKKPKASGSDSRVLSRCPARLTKWRGVLDELRELCRSGGTGAEMPACAIQKPPADQRHPPQT